MATVYLAVDLRHQRPVAIKVLKPELAAVLGAERFLHEIRVTANFQHPNILPLFDSGEADSSLFYVMPYVEGESLRHRLQREKQLPVEDAVRIATEVASALEYAHRHGVIHRDIKPENVLLHEGRALVADFGIALAIQTAGGSRLTESGLALGTPSYMSPEQAAGDRQLDARTDIYSLGCVAYEVLAGEPPHQGPTMQAVIARVMTETPRPLPVVRPTVPPNVATAVHRALERSPADRFATAVEFAAALVGPGPLPAEAAPAGGVSGKRAGLRVRAPILVGAAIVLAAGGVVLGRFSVSRSQPAQQRVEFYFGTDSTNQLDDRTRNPLRISRDGRRIVYVGRTSSGTKLFLASLSEREPRPIPGTEGASTPAFSPDGDTVAFFAGSAIRKVPVTEGSPVTLASDLALTEVYHNLDWGPNGNLVYAIGVPARLWSVSAAGGKPAPLIATDSSCSYGSPTILPGARAVLAACVVGSRDELTIVSLTGGAPRKLGIDGNGPRFAAGRILYIGRGGTLFAQRFDPSSLAIVGGPSVLSNDVDRYLPQSRSTMYDFSETGVLVHVVQPTRTQLVLVGESEPERVLLTVDGFTPRFSPDGQSIAYVTFGQRDAGLWVYSLAQNTTQRLVFEGPFNYPAWSLDGRRIVFSRGVAANADLWSVAANGGGEAEPFLQRARGQYQASFTRDGKWVVFIDAQTQDSSDMVAMSIAPNAPAEVLLKTPFVESQPTVSPDGRWLAYVSDESGRYEVYVRPFRRPGGRQLISIDGGDGPVWSRGGGKIYYRHGSQLILATVMPGDPFLVKERRLVFERPDDVIIAINRHYDVSPDGSQFVFVTRPGERRIVVTLGALEPR